MPRFNRAAAQAIVDDQVEIQKTKIESAKATLQVAHLKRELAESALKEYEQGLFVQEKATLEAELENSPGRVENGLRAYPGSTRSFRPDQAGIKRLDLRPGQRIPFLGPGIWPSWLHKAAGFVVEQAESKLKVLLEYSKPKRIKELGAELDLAKSEELVALPIGTSRRPSSSDCRIRGTSLQKNRTKRPTR